MRLHVKSTLIFILYGLIALSKVSALPPSVKSLNEWLILDDKNTLMVGTCVGDNRSIHVCYFDISAGYPYGLYYMRIDSSGQEIVGPKLVHVDSTLLDFPMVIVDKLGNIHITARRVGLDCVEDYYIMLDKTGDFLTGFEPRPAGILSTRVIKEDSLFVAFRTGDLKGCGASIEEIREQYWLFLQKSPHSPFSVINLPFQYPNYHDSEMRVLPSGDLFIVSVMAPDSHDRNRPFRFHSFLAAPEEDSTSNHLYGEMRDNCYGIFENLNKDILLEGGRIVRLGDSTAYYMRVPPTDYYFDEIVLDSIIVVLFDKHGNIIKGNDTDGPRIEYRNIDFFGETEQLIEFGPRVRHGTVIRAESHFGLVSFKEFPHIIIDVGNDE